MARPLSLSDRFMKHADLRAARQALIRAATWIELDDNKNNEELERAIVLLQRYFRDELRAVTQDPAKPPTG